MTVAELIAHLQTFDQSLPICFAQYSDWTELTPNLIEVETLQVPRGDGYVGSHRPDRPAQPWLTFPGN